MTAERATAMLPVCVDRVPIFAGLTPAQQQSVAAVAHVMALAPGERVYGVGDDVSQLYVVQAGRVRIVRIIAPGHEQLIRMAGPGEVFGEYPFLTGREPVAWVFAVEPTQLCVFDHRDLVPLFTSYPAIAVTLLHTLAERLGEAEGRLATLCGTDVTTRLAGYLLSLRHHSAIQLPMAKRDVASYLGTTPESLSRALNRLQSDGLIKVCDRGRLSVLDRRGLEALTRA